MPVHKKIKMNKQVRSGQAKISKTHHKMKMIASFSFLNEASPG